MASGGRTVNKFHYKVIVGGSEIALNSGDMEDHIGYDTLDAAETAGKQAAEEYGIKDEYRVIPYPAYRAPNQYNNE